MLARRLLLKSTLLLPLISPNSAAAAAEINDGSWPHLARQRTLPWRLRLPDGDKPCPLVLYSHGLGGSREGGQAWGSAWAESGIAVLHLQHPGSDIEVLRGGARSLQAAASADQMIERLLDLRFAINELLRRSAAGEAPWDRIRTDAIGVAGHSFGALTTQAVAGQRYPGVDDLSDPRPKAFVALSPSLPLGVKLSPTEAFAGVVRPFFALTGSLDASPIQRNQAGAQRAAVYDALPHGQRALLWLDGADHQTFGGGRPSLREAAAQGAQRVQEPDHRHSRLIARATAAWWHWRLLGDETARLRLASLEGLSNGDRLLLG
jgi:predicted dienelactone hydrolase